MDQHKITSTVKENDRLYEKLKRYYAEKHNINYAVNRMLDDYDDEKIVNQLIIRLKKDINEDRAEEKKESWKKFGKGFMITFAGILVFILVKGEDALHIIAMTAGIILTIAGFFVMGKALQAILGINKGNSIAFVPKKNNIRNI